MRFFDFIEVPLIEFNGGVYPAACGIKQIFNIWVVEGALFEGCYIINRP